MIYLYKAKLNYSVIIFLVAGATIIGYLLDLNYVAICFLNLFALLGNLGTNLFYSELGFIIDSKSKTLEFQSFQMSKKRKEIFKLEDLNFEWKEIFSSAGIYDQFLLKKGSEIIVRPRANIFSLSTDQIKHLSEKLKELGVPEVNKT